MEPIVIVDYGMGNLRSVQKALEKVGAEAIITSDKQRIGNADKIILPGVGAFRDASNLLRQTGLDEVIRRHAAESKWLLGICLGLQLLFEKSYEDGEHEGLGIIHGDVVRFDCTSPLKVPHMGWNQVELRRPSPLFEAIPDRSDFYFVHSYYVRPTNREVILCETDYPLAFTSGICQDRVIAVQFHPEKSQGVGLRVLHNFSRLR